MFKVDLLLNTVMWNEGFDKAGYPWLRLYTDNAQWVKSLPSDFSVVVENSWFGQDFDVKISEFTGVPILPDAEQKEWEDSDNHEYVYEKQAKQKRFQGILLGVPSADLDKIVQDRLDYWDGI